MSVETRRITVEPGSELDRLLEEANGAPILLERGGATYRLVRATPDGKEDIWAGYDHDAVMEAMTRGFGSWAGIDADAIIEQIYRAREEGSRPASRP